MSDTFSGDNLLKDSTLYREFLAEREEILKHKWLESEKAGYDIGFERALVDWVINHRAKWKHSRRAAHAQPTCKSYDTHNGSQPGIR